MYKGSIKQWLKNDRPREKFIQKGCEYLSDTELLAILVRSGTQDRSALVVAQEVMGLANDNLSLLAKLKIKDLLTVKGIGNTKAVTLMTALELGRRPSVSEAVDRSKIASSLDALDLMKPLMEDLETEQFRFFI